jgi:hypothetical protein
MGKIHNREMQNQLMKLISKNDGLKYFNKNGFACKIIKNNIIFNNDGKCEYCHFKYWSASQCKQEMRYIKATIEQNKQNDIIYDIMK